MSPAIAPQVAIAADTPQIATDDDRIAAKSSSTLSFLASQKRRAEYAAMRDLPPTTLDGERLTLMVNAGLRDDVAALDVTGADGIGLFRTEFEFLISAELPKRDRQVRVYRDPGYVQAPLRRGADRTGAVLAVGDSRDEALARAEAAVAAIRFRLAAPDMADEVSAVSDTGV